MGTSQSASASGGSADHPFIGIEIGGTKLQVVAGDQSLRIHRRWRGTVDPAQGAKGICRQIQEALKEIVSKATQAVGVGFGGPINYKTGQIERSHHIEGWKDFPLGDWLRQVSGLPVAVDNDSNIAALGEAVAGAGVGSNLVFYTNMGSGVGGGMVVDGQIYHGAVPGECEFGHICLDRNGNTVESRCAGWAVDKRIRAAATLQPQGILARLLGHTPGGEARHLAEALRRGDPDARRILAEVGEDLGFALSHVVHLFHPQVIVMGGGLSLVGEPLREAVAAHLPRFVMQAFLPPPPLHLARLGEDAVPVGAMRLAMSKP